MAAPSVRAVGTPTTGASATFVPNIPAHAAGDILILSVSNSHNAMSAPAGGWALVTGSGQGNGAGGAAADSVYCFVYWLRAASGAESNPTVDPGTGVALGVIISVQGCIASGDPFDAIVNGQSTVGTSPLSIPSPTTTGADRLILGTVATDRDEPSTGTFFSTPTNADLTGIVLQVNRTISSSSGAGLGIWSGTKATAGAVANSSMAAGAAEEWAYTVVALLPAASTQDLTPSLVTNTQTFHGPTITTGAVSLTPALFTNTQTFYAATVTSSYALQPGLLTNTQTFHGPTITVGAVTLAPSLVTNDQVFYGPTVAIVVPSVDPPTRRIRSGPINYTLTRSPVLSLGRSPVSGLPRRRVN
jgi:hypothetical protein